MIEENVLTFVLSIYGFLFGCFLPGSLLYVLLFIKKNKFNLKFIPRLLGRLSLIVFFFIISMALFGLVIQWFGIEPDKIPEASTRKIGLSMGLGFLVSFVTLVVGIIKGLKSAIDAYRKKDNKEYNGIK